MVKHLKAEFGDKVEEDYETKGEENVLNRIDRFRRTTFRKCRITLRMSNVILEYMSKKGYEPVTSNKIKLRLLNLLKKDSLTPNQMARKTKSNYRTVKKALIFLEKIRLIQKCTLKLTPKKTIEMYELTDLGRKVVKDMGNLKWDT